jgi:PHD/YefM family antitoxin component YafN of YafNO toxin-antitoxin module
MRKQTAQFVATSRLFCGVLICVFGLALSATVTAQKNAGSKSRAAKTKSTKNTAQKAKPVDELSRLREEFIKATNEYKDSLGKLRALLEKKVPKAEERLAQSKELFAQGLISKHDLDQSEAALTEAKDKVAEVDRRLAGADSQIADTLLEAEAEKTLAKTKPLARGGLMRTAAMIRYNGGAVWGLSDVWKVQRFFSDAFKKPLPVAVFGQGAIHDRWRLDHHNAIDVSLHPDSPEGQALLAFLRANGIPFLAFRAAIPGTATGPHIHVGRPSHRY